MLNLTRSVEFSETELVAPELKPFEYFTCDPVDRRTAHLAFLESCLDEINPQNGEDINLNDTNSDLDSTLDHELVDKNDKILETKQKQRRVLQPLPSDGKNGGAQKYFALLKQQTS